MFQWIFPRNNHLFLWFCQLRLYLWQLTPFWRFSILDLDLEKYFRSQLHYHYFYLQHNWGCPNFIKIIKSFCNFVCNNWYDFCNFFVINEVNAYMHLCLSINPLPVPVQPTCVYVYLCVYLHLQCTMYNVTNNWLFYMGMAISNKDK